MSKKSKLAIDLESGNNKDKAKDKSSATTKAKDKSSTTTKAKDKSSTTTKAVARGGRGRGGLVEDEEEVQQDDNDGYGYYQESYWDNRYKDEKGYLEWYFGFDQLKDLLDPYVVDE